METLHADARDFEALARSLLERGAGFRFVAHGRSMQPFIRDGDILLVRPATPDALRLGEILLHRTERGAVVAHRLTRTPVGGHLQTAADHAIAQLDRIQAGDVIGRVALRERGGRSTRMDGRLATWLGLWWYRLRPARRIVRRLRSLITPRANPPGAQPPPGA